MWTTRSLHKITDGDFLAVSRRALTQRPGNASVARMPLLDALKLAISTGAGDETIQKMGVTPMDLPKDPEPLQRRRDGTELLAANRPFPFWYNGLYLNRDGSLILSRILSLEPAPFYQSFDRPASQAEAILFTLRHTPSEYSLRILGVPV